MSATAITVDQQLNGSPEPFADQASWLSRCLAWFKSWQANRQLRKLEHERFASMLQKPVRIGSTTSRPMPEPHMALVACIQRIEDREPKRLARIAG